MTDGVAPIPPAEFDVTDALVRELLRSQHPDLAELELRQAARGWDNVLYRLGPDLVVRLPRRAVAAALVEHEQRWLPELAPRLPLPIPAPVRIGRPELGYPWPWSITPWFDGDAAADVSLADPAADAKRLGDFMAALHHAAPHDAPANPARDIFIGDRADRFVDVTGRIAGLLDRLAPDGVRRARARWNELVRARPHPAPTSWVAGDVHTGNLIVVDGALAAVIDFGDLCAGDPAVDLAVGWMLFAPEARDVFRSAASEGEFPVDDDAWHRAEAWAWYFAVLYLANSADDERLARMGRALARTLFAELA